MLPAEKLKKDWLKNICLSQLADFISYRSAYLFYLLTSKLGGLWIARSTILIFFQN